MQLSDYLLPLKGVLMEARIEDGTLTFSIEGTCVVVLNLDRVGYDVWETFTYQEREYGLNACAADKACVYIYRTTDPQDDNPHRAIDTSSSLRVGLVTAPVEKKRLCIHHNDADGFCAALAVWYRYGNACEYVETNYGETPPDVTGRDVLIVDFSYPRAVLEAMYEKAESLLVVDHHKSAQADLEGLDYCIFDTTKSGCVLAWEYLFPTTGAPQLFRWVQDRDLWKFELADTKPVLLALRTVKKDFRIWAELDNNPEDLRLAGRTLQRLVSKQINAAVCSKRTVLFNNTVRVPCVNVSNNISETLHELLTRPKKTPPFAFAYFDVADKRVVALRSADGGMDVSEVAALFGGGGHRNAAGFRLEIGETCWTEE